MSGRLVILPKKSYCPWNSKNIERVERDEKEYKEKQQQLLGQSMEGNSKLRIEQLKKQQQQQQQSHDKIFTTGRFSLFDQEEKEHIKQQKEQELFAKIDQQNKNDKGKKRKLSSYRQGHDDDDTPFYMLPRKQESQHIDRKDTKLKYDMDPMKIFLHEDQLKEKTQVSKMESSNDFIGNNVATANEQQHD